MTEDYETEPNFNWGDLPKLPDDFWGEGVTHTKHNQNPDERKDKLSQPKVRRSFWVWIIIMTIFLLQGFHFTRKLETAKYAFASIQLKS